MLRVRPRVRPCLAVLAIAAATATAAFGHAGAGNAQTVEPAWLQVVNSYRMSAGLPRVAEDRAWMDAVAKHAVYLAMTGSMVHGEDAGSPYYSAEGAAAAAKSVLAGGRGTQRSDRDLIDSWMTAPFHALHFLEPRLQRVAFASTHGIAGASLNSSAVLDVVHGLGTKVVTDRPITFPADGSTMPLTSFVGETPDPLTACPGYTAPAGLPLLAMFPTPPGTATATLSTGGQRVEICLIDSGYENPDASEQRTARMILTQKNAVVIVPRMPLQAGATYTARVTTSSAGMVEWSFTPQPAGSPLPTPSAVAVALLPPGKVVAVKTR